MKILKILGISLFTLLLGVNSYLLLDKKNKNNTNTKSKSISQLNYVQNLETLLYTNIYLNIDSNLETDLKCFDEKGKKFHLSELINERPKLILRISERMCDLCITSELNSLKRINTDIRKDDIILLATYSNFNSLRILKKKHGIPFKIYKVGTIHESSLEQQNTPYYFVLEKNMIPKYQFIPDKNMNKLTDKYLNDLTPYFLNKYGLIKEIKSGIEFTNSIYNFGKVKNGKTHSTIFTFNNNMEKPLIIQDIKTSCGCTISKYSKAPVLPK